MASGLAHKSEKGHVSIFLYAMGDCADDILTTLSIDEETVSFADIKTELNNYFGARRSVVVEQAHFTKRVQRQSEAIDSCIQNLYKIAEGCNYGTLKEELIRDRIVVGVADDDLSEQLQSKANLTLQEAVELSRQKEARKESQPFIRESRSSATHDVDFIKKRPGAHKTHHHHRGQNAPSRLKVNLSYHGRTMTETISVLSDQPCLLLSKRACVELGIVRRVDTLAKTSTPDSEVNSQGSSLAWE